MTSIDLALSPPCRGVIVLHTRLEHPRLGHEIVFRHALAKDKQGRKKEKEKEKKEKKRKKSKLTVSLGRG